MDEKIVLTPAEEVRHRALLAAGDMYGLVREVATQQHRETRQEARLKELVSAVGHACVLIEKQERKQQQILHILNHAPSSRWEETWQDIAHILNNGPMDDAELLKAWPND